MIALIRLRTLALLLAILAAGAVPAAAQKNLTRLLAEDAASLPRGIDAGDPLTARKIGSALARLAAEHARHLGSGAAGALEPSNPLLRLRGDRVLIDAVAEGDAAILEGALVAAGLEGATRYGRIVSGYLPIGAIAELSRLTGLRFARPSYPATGVGSVDSQGDAAMSAPFSRSELGIDGSGITVGTLSDSYNCLAGAPGDVSSTDLPVGIVVLDDTKCAAPGGTDEGRAMMQVVADVAPGAAQGFHTAAGGQAAFALGIEELAGCPPGSQPGCTPDPGGFAAEVINDDVYDPDEPFFQDGIIAQAVDNVVANGVAYFTLAGNHGRKSYEAPFVGSGLVAPLGGELHDFDPGPGVDTLQEITVPVGATVMFSFQWDEPYFSVSGAPGSASDCDMWVYDAAGAPILVSFEPNVGADPIEVFSFENDGSFDADEMAGPDTTFNLAISNFAGPDAGLMKYIALVNEDLDAFTVNEFDTASGTIYGHMNSAGAVTVGAAFYFNTPNFDGFPPIAEAYSSAGSLPILFDGAGASISELRAKPDLLAPDGGNNTFFGSDIPDPGDGSDLDTLPNFFGTSAATAHAAGVGALALETSSLTPAGLKQVLQGAAGILDMGPVGRDDDTGFGYLEALPLLESTVATGSWNSSCGIDDYSLSGVPNDGPQTFRATTSITWGDGFFDEAEGLAPTHIFTDGFESGDTASWSSSCP